jgi:hypothetical protein
MRRDKAQQRRGLDELLHESSSSPGGSQEMKAVHDSKHNAISGMIVRCSEIVACNEK